MGKKVSYTIPFVGLKKERHTFQYQLDEKFFQREDHSMIQKGIIQAEVHFDKSVLPYILDFELDGYILTECDRCASEMKLPLHSSNKVYVKFDKDADELFDEDMEILYLHPEDEEIDLSDYLYDFTLLSIPYSKLCSDVGQDCDPQVIRLLEMESKKDEETEKYPDPRWEGLNKLKDLK